MPPTPTTSPLNMLLTPDLLPDDAPPPHHAPGSPARLACLQHLALWPDGCGEAELLLAIEKATGLQLADDELHTVLAALRRDERIAKERTMDGPRWFAPGARQAADVRMAHAAQQAQCPAAASAALLD